MKHIALLFLALAFAIGSYGQNGEAFKGYLYNSEYKVYMQINFVENDVVPDGQDLFGALPGYLAYKDDSRLWLITEAKVVNEKTARLAITNDYGSEDLTATLSFNGNGEYTLTQNKGSRIKIAVNRKWVKIPQTLKFKVASKEEK